MLIIFSKLQSGQGIVEFALLLVLVGILSTAGLMLFGESVGDAFDMANSSLPPFHMGGIQVTINPATFTPAATEPFFPTSTPTPGPTPIPTATPTVAPTPTYRQWCLSQGPGYTWNWRGQCMHNHFMVVPPA
jgi:Flp pilus assembly pilin Flp